MFGVCLLCGVACGSLLFVGNCHWSLLSYLLIRFRVVRCWLLVVCCSLCVVCVSSCCVVCCFVFLVVARCVFVVYCCCVLYVVFARPSLLAVRWSLFVCFLVVVYVVVRCLLFVVRYMLCGSVVVCCS